MKYIKPAIAFFSLSFLLLPNFTYADGNSSLIFDYTLPNTGIMTKEADNFSSKQKINDLLFSDENIPYTPVIEDNVKNQKKEVREKSENSISEIKPLEVLDLRDEKKQDIFSILENTSVNQKNTDLSKYSSSHRKILSTAKSLLGVPYVYGGNTPKGFDCSGYVKYCYTQAGIEIPRTTYTQIKLGKSVDISNIDIGDLIFFDTVTNIPYVTNKKEGDDGIFKNIPVTPFKKLPSNASHVGIYIGEGLFMHASSYNSKIVVEHLDSPYFKNRIIDIKRYI